MKGWTETALKKITKKIGSGATPRGGDNSYKLEGTPLIRSQNILDFSFSTKGLAFIDDIQAEELRNVKVLQKDILLNITGDSVARCCLAPNYVNEGRVNQHVAIIRPDRNVASSEFIFYSLQNLKEELLAIAEIGATRRALTKGMLEELIIKHPNDILEQKAIAAVLSSLDDKIDLLHRQNATLEAMAEALFRQWFVVEAKDDWEDGRVDDLFILQRGFDLPAQERVHGIYPVISAGGVNGHHATALVSAPGVVTGRSGVIGSVFYIQENFWPLNTTLWVKQYKKATPLFTFELLKILNLNGMNAGSAVPTLNRNHVHALPLKIPPKEKIVDFEFNAKKFYLKIHSNQTQIRTLEKLRDTLLPKLMSGEIRVDF